MSLATKLDSLAKASKWLVHRRPGLLIIHNGRCGSTVLQRLLETDSRLSVNHEPWQNHSATLLRVLKGKLKSGNRINSVDVKLTDLQPLGHGGGAADAVRLLRTLGYARLCHLYRSNYLQWAVSVRRGQLTKQWHARTTDKLEGVTFSLPLQQFESHLGVMTLTETFARLDADHDEIERIIGSDGLKLVFEDDIAKDPRVGAGRLLRYIGLESAAIESDVPIQRTATRKAVDELTNWPEVASVLRETKWAWMVDD